MYHELAVYLTSCCDRQTKKSNAEREVLVYGAELLISSSVEIIILLAMGAVMKRFWETVFFLAFFCPLRSVTGGYHAPGYRSCTLLFSFAFFILLLVLQPIPVYVQILLLCYSSVVIWYLAPVEDANKPLSKERREWLCQKGRIYLMVELALCGGTWILFSKGIVQSFIVCAFPAVSFLLFIGNIKNKNRRECE